MSNSKLRFAGAGAVIATALAVVAGSGSAQARPAEDDRDRPGVATPVLKQCDIPDSVGFNGQENVPAAVNRPEAANGARVRTTVTYLESGVDAAFGRPANLGPNVDVASVAMTSWYESKGKLQVRAVIAPVVREGITAPLYVTIVDDPDTQDGGQGDAKDTRKLRKNAMRVKLDGKAICLRASASSVEYPAVWASWHSNFDRKHAEPVPTPSTTMTLPSNPRRVDEVATAMGRKELQKLAAAATNHQLAASTK